MARELPLGDVYVVSLAPVLMVSCGPVLGPVFLWPLCKPWQLVRSILSQQHLQHTNVGGDVMRWVGGVFASIAAAVLVHICCNRLTCRQLGLFAWTQ
jgi:hypothetical protein